MSESSLHFWKNHPEFARMKIALIANYTFIKENDIPYFSGCHNNKTPYKRNLREERRKALFGSKFEGTAPHGREVMAAGNAVAGHSQEVERDEHWCPASLSLVRPHIQLALLIST